MFQLDRHDEAADGQDDDRVSQEEGGEEVDASLERGVETPDHGDGQYKDVEIGGSGDGGGGRVPPGIVDAGALECGIPGLGDGLALPDGGYEGGDAGDPEVDGEGAVVGAEDAGVEEDGGEFGEGDAAVEEEDADVEALGALDHEVGVDGHNIGGMEAEANLGPRDDDC